MSFEGLNNTYYGSFVSSGASIVINTADVWNTTDMDASDSNNCVLEGPLVTGSTLITAYATHASGVRTKVTCSGTLSDLADDQLIAINNTTNYNSDGTTLYQVSEVEDVTHTFVIDKLWDGNDDATGGFTRAPTFVNTQGSEAGDFLIIAKFVGTTGVAEDIEVAVSLDGGLNIDYLKQTKTYNASAVEAETILMGVITVYRGQRVGLWVRNKDGSNNISAGEGTFLVQRLKYYDL